MIETYEKRLPIYTACQWDGENVDEMRKFIGDAAIIIEHSRDIIDGDFAFGYDLQVKTTRGRTQFKYGIVKEKRLAVNYGDYVVINDMDETIKVYSAADFEMKFKLKEKK